MMMSCAQQRGINMHDESETIFAETEAFANAWNRGDAAAAASFFTEDGIRIGAFGDVQTGRSEIKDAYDRLLHQTMAGAKVMQERGSVRMLTADLAIWEGGIEITPSGSELPLRGHVVQIMKKTGDRWLILEAHPKLYPSPPNAE